MVQLKGPAEPVPVTGFTFQFRYGAIKSNPSLTSTQSHIQFQFRYGAIKSFTEKLNSAGQDHFNSAMVQLKVPKHAYSFH